MDVKSISKQIGDRQTRFKKSANGRPRRPTQHRRHDDTLVLGGGKGGAWTAHDLRRAGATLRQALDIDCRSAAYTVDLRLLKESLLEKVTSYKILVRYFDKTACIVWSVAGVAIGILAWIWGESPIPSFALKLASGFGLLLFALIFASIALALMGFFLKGRLGYLARGDFQNALRWCHPKLLRATSVVFGLVLIAVVCWGVAGSINALKTALLGSLLVAALFWYWGGLAVIDDELLKRFSSVSR